MSTTASATPALGRGCSSRDHLSGTGAVHRFCERFRELLYGSNTQGTAVAVSNATMGIFACFLAIGLKKGDEVIASPLTWGGTIAGVLALGGVPVFADVESDTLCLDPESVRRRLSRRTRVVLATDQDGYPCEAEALRDLSEKRGLWFFQDCASAFGAWRGQHHTGVHADAAVFSLGPGKGLDVGEGGVVTIRSEELAEAIVWLTQHPEHQKARYPLLLSNPFALALRISPYSAVMADASFEKALGAIEESQKEVRSMLESFFSQHLIETPPPAPGVEPSYFRLTVTPRSDRIHEMKRVLRDLGLAYELLPPPRMGLLYQEPALRFYGFRRSVYCPAAEDAIARRWGLRLVSCQARRSSSRLRPRHVDRERLQL